MLIRFLVLVSFFSKAAYCACPTGWALRGQWCYFILEEKVDRTRAESLCDSHEAQLVTLFEEKDWDFISGLLESSSYQETGAWIGIESIAGKWFWYNSVKEYDAHGHWDSLDGHAPSLSQYDLHGRMFNPSGQKVVMTAAEGSSLLHPYCRRNYDSRELCDTGHGWVRRNGKCFKAFTPQPWADAFSTCSMHSSEMFLPTIKVDLATLGYLVKDTKGVWVGATPIGSNKDSSGFVNKDGTKVKLLPVLRGQQKTLTENTTQSCLAVVQSSSSQNVFRSLACDEELAFVCVRQEGSCPTGWKRQGTDCYHWYTRPDQRVTWSQAVEKCHSQGARLVQPVVSPGAKVLLSKALQDNDVQSAWFGIKGGQLGYVSLDKKTVIPKVMTFDSTEGLGDLDQCGVTDFDPKRTVPSAEYCYLTKNFVCTMKITDIIQPYTPANSHCDDGWTLFNHQCLKLMTLPSNYTDAQTQCTSNGASLATVENESDQSFFSTGVFSDFGIEKVWISVRYDTNFLVDTGFSTKLGAYVLPNGKQAIFTNMGKPNATLIKTKQCIVVETGTLSPFPGVWAPEGCGVAHPFVCQKKAKTGSSGPAKAVNVPWSPRCGPGWVYSDQSGFCYWVDQFLYRTWEDARASCQDMSSELVSVGGDEEMKSIGAILSLPEFDDVMEPLWSGGADKGDNYGWTWSDGKPFSYFHWGEAQPEYSDVDGNTCVAIPFNDGFQWEAHPCERQLPYICKKYASSGTDGKSTDQSQTNTSCVQETLISGNNPVQSPQAFSASSSRDELHSPLHSRMTPSNRGFWRPSKDDNNEWLQVSFAAPVIISTILLKGNNDLLPLYVSKFKFQYRYDESSPWYWVQIGNKEILDGVKIPGETAIISFEKDIEASSVRLWPVEWVHGIGVQFEVVGCRRAEPCKRDYAISGPLIVPDDQISTSSGDTLASWRGRIRAITEGKLPIPWLSDNDDDKPWIKVDLGQTRIVRGIKLKSGPFPGKYTRQFKLLFSENPQDDLIDFMTYQQPYGTPYIFDGLSDQVTSKEIVLLSSVRARVIALLVVNVTGSTNLFFDVSVCPIGCTPSPMLSSLRSDAALTAPVVSDSHYVDLDTVVQVKAVATQGAMDSWVRTYTLSFSTDGTQFESYHNSRIFKGNFDDTTVVKNELPTPINARFVRLFPVDVKGEEMLKWEVYACAKLSSKSASIGCYADDVDSPAFDRDVLQDANLVMNPDMCISHCYNKGYHYAGIEKGQRCGCGNNYGVYGKSDRCNMACQPPFGNFTCGGPEDNTVYMTGIGPKSLVCPAGWLEYKDSCYFVDGDEKSTWFGAQSACQARAAHLVDIKSKRENDFVVSVLASKAIESSWTGLNDNTQPLHFKGSSSDDVSVSYTQWDHHQPVFNPGLEQHGVIIRTSSQGWSNVFSEGYHNYMCEARKIPSDKLKEDITDVGCQRGWHGYMDKCLQFNPLKQTWDGAVTLCQLANSSIEEVTDRTESAFISEHLSFSSGKYWIGVALAKDTGQFVNKVHDKPLAFSNWDRYNPVPIDQGGCVAVGTSFSSGLWTNVGCEEMNHFVCQAPRRGSFPHNNPHTSPSPSGSCPNGWIESTNSCYHIYNTNWTTKLSWFKASDRCQELGATLASLHNKADIENVHAKRTHEDTGNLWMGLNNLDDISGYAWTDKSVVDFIPWGQGQPPREIPSTRLCGEVDTSSRSLGLQDCSLLQGYVCSISKGQKLKQLHPVTYPTPEPDSGACSSKTYTVRWFKYGDYCYHLSDGDGGTGTSLTWRESGRWCRGQGGHLASVTSGLENEFIQGMALKTMAVTVSSIWIGLNQLNPDRGYSWTDESPTGLWSLNWNANEPNDEDGFEGCVAMQLRNGKWNDEHCSKRQGFVCKKSAYPMNTKPPSLPAPTLKGNCPKGFHRLDSKCYRLFGLSKGEVRLPWEQARKACQGLGDGKYRQPDLVSITSTVENAFVTLLLRQSKSSAWIGLRRVPETGTGGYMWTDEEDLGYENWNRHEPNMGQDKKSCVYMYGPIVYAGKWNDVDCEHESAPYICQTLVDEHLPKEKPLPSVTCKTSLGYHSSGGTCLKSCKSPANWTQARDVCRQDGGHLASVLDGYDLARVVVESGRVGGGEVWLGLNDMQSPGVYTWDSGYPVSYTSWAHHQPIDTPGGQRCVYLNQHALFDKGDCDQQQKSYICQMDTDPPNETPPIISDECPDKNFHLIGSRCYNITTGVPNGALTYEGALQACRDRGAVLASIHDQTLAFPIIPGMTLWIGLRESLNEGFRWEDGSPLSLTKWAPAMGQPGTGTGTGTERSRSLSDDTLEEKVVDTDCVATDWTQLWARHDCEDKLGFICIKSKESAPLPTYSPPISAVSSTVQTPPTAHNAHNTPPSPSTVGQETPHQNGSPITHPPPPSSSSSSSSSTSPPPPTQPNNNVIHSSTTSKNGSKVGEMSSAESSNLTSGETAGVVIGALLAMTLLIAGSVAFWKREQLKRSFLGREFSKARGNFESRLYTETHQNELATRGGGVGNGNSGGGSGGSGSGNNNNGTLYMHNVSDESETLGTELGQRNRGASVAYDVTSGDVHIHEDAGFC